MISKQTYTIIPKNNEVDRWMTPEMQVRVREVHPEVTGIGNCAALRHSKKTPCGQQERLGILRRDGIVFDPIQERRRLAARAWALTI